MAKLDNDDFTGILTMDTDGDVVDLWLAEYEERIFRQHFNKDFADLVYDATPPADLSDFITGFFNRFRRILFAEYQKQKNYLTAGNLASEVEPSVGSVGINFKARVIEIHNEGVDDCNTFVLSYDWSNYDVNFIPFQHQNVLGL